MSTTIVHLFSKVLPPTHPQYPTNWLLCCHFNISFFFLHSISNSLLPLLNLQDFFISLKLFQDSQNTSTYTYLVHSSQCFQKTFSKMKNIMTTFPCLKFFNNMTSHSGNNNNTLTHLPNLTLVYFPSFISSLSVLPSQSSSFKIPTILNNFHFSESTILFHSLYTQSSLCLKNIPSLSK